MDKIYPPHLFRSGSTPRDGSFLHPCARANYRITSILHSLHHTHLGQNHSSARASTSSSSSSQKQEAFTVPFCDAEDYPREALYRYSFETRACPAIYSSSFYQAFNRLQVQSYRANRIAGVRIRSQPPIFDLNGRLLREPVVCERLRRKPSPPAKMPSSCQDIRAALAACLQSSDCIMIERHKPSECLRSPLLETLPTKCQQLKKGYGECKRGMVDMRKRFRGNQPLAVSKETEGGSESRPGQLYAGKPAYQSTAHSTDGREEVADWRELENEKYRKS